MKEAAEILESFGQALRKARENRQLSQEKLGLISQLDRTYISAVERGKRNISLINMCKLADALRIDLADLIAPVEQQSHEPSY